MEELHIPIFRKVYDLYKTFHGLRNVVPKADRHTIWQRAETLILELIEGILLASQLPKERKLPVLEQASMKLNVLRIMLRLIRDTKALDLKKCVPLQEMIDKIGRMLGGWMKSVKAHSPSPSSASFLRERERERESVEAAEKEVPRGDKQGRGEPEVVVAVVIPVVVDVHTTLVDREFGTVVVRERNIAHSRLRTPEVEACRSLREPIPSSSCILFGSIS